MSALEFLRELLLNAEEALDACGATPYQRQRYVLTLEDDIRLYQRIEWETRA